jgi:hypothetical protein
MDPPVLRCVRSIATGAHISCVVASGAVTVAIATAIEHRPLAPSQMRPLSPMRRFETIRHNAPLPPTTHRRNRVMSSQLQTIVDEGLAAAAMEYEPTFAPSGTRSPRFPRFRSTGCRCLSRSALIENLRAASEHVAYQCASRVVAARRPEPCAHTWVDLVRRVETPRRSNSLVRRVSRFEAIGTGPRPCATLPWTRRRRLVFCETRPGMSVAFQRARRRDDS